MAFDLFACSEFFLDATGGFPLGSVPLHAITGFQLFSHTALGGAEFPRQ